MSTEIKNFADKSQISPRNKKSFHLHRFVDLLIIRRKFSTEKGKWLDCTTHLCDRIETPFFVICMRYTASEVTNVNDVFSDARKLKF